jgi:hypothetical protein
MWAAYCTALLNAASSARPMALIVRVELLPGDAGIPVQRDRQHGPCSFDRGDRLVGQSSSGAAARMSGGFLQRRLTSARDARQVVPGPDHRPRSNCKNWSKLDAAWFKLMSDRPLPASRCHGVAAATASAPGSAPTMPTQPPGARPAAPITTQRYLLRPRDSWLDAAALHVVAIR